MFYLYYFWTLSTIFACAERLLKWNVCIMLASNVLPSSPKWSIQERTHIKKKKVIAWCSDPLQSAKKETNCAKMLVVEKLLFFSPFFVIVCEWKSWEPTPSHAADCPFVRRGGVNPDAHTHTHGNITLKWNNLKSNVKEAFCWLWPATMWKWMNEN